MVMLLDFREVPAQIDSPKHNIGPIVIGSYYSFPFHYAFPAADKPAEDSKEALIRSRRMELLLMR